MKRYSANNKINKYECTTDSERVCAIIVAASCYNALSLYQSLHAIFICNRQMAPLLIIRQQGSDTFISNEPRMNLQIKK